MKNLKGKNNPNYKNGLYVIKNKFCKCGKKIHHTSEMCASCANSIKSLKSWDKIGRRKQNYCKCGVKISYDAKRCRKCMGKEISKRLTGKIRKEFKGKGNPFYGKKHTKETKQIISKNTKINQKRLWKDNNHAIKMVKVMRDGMNLKPNKPETVLKNLLNYLFPKEYKYVGDWKFTIDRYNPDFINCNGQKKIIELFGDYWHNLSSYKKRDKIKLKKYKNFGYKTLVVWQKELKNIDKLTNKLQKFHLSEVK